MYFSLEAVLHLAQLRHDLDGFRSARGLLHNGIVEAHKDVVFLVTVSQSVRRTILNHQAMGNAHLFVGNGEFASGDLVVLGKVLQRLDGLALQHRNGKLDVGLCVFVAGLHTR